jgi:hypothetical protein
MLVFRKGRWHTVDIPFSDPMLTDGHRRAAAALTVNGMLKGASVEAAVAAAEKTMYQTILTTSAKVKTPFGG